MGVDILHTRNLFLRCICGIYMCAFSSLFLQIRGLYGENGILPAHNFFHDTVDVTECVTKKKSLLCFAPVIGLNISYFMEAILVIGTVLSFLGFIWNKFCSAFSFFLLWMFYLSLYQVGQTFLWFQWDILLLEVGFLCILVAPITKQAWSEYRPRNLVTMWLIQWCLFRLMFASGVVKLQSLCPSWWELSALPLHYESQCIPTPLAWYFYQLPVWLHKLSVVATYIIEIPIPFLFFSPIRAHRIFSFYAQVILQVLIILSGNYTFFNWLTIALCISLLDDVHLNYQYVRDLSFGFIAYMRSLFSWVLKWAAYALLAYISVTYFSLRIENALIECKIAFTKDEFSHWLSKTVPFTIALGTFSLIITIAEALTSALIEVQTLKKKIAVFFATLIYSAAALFMFGISLVPYTSLDKAATKEVWPVFRHYYVTTSELHLASSYGLFRSMTGIGGRPEVILEGSNSLSGPWKEYIFRYKPGDVTRPLPFVAPHQPRLDWQMWFAALGTYSHNPWLISLAYRLLSGEPEVLKLLDPSSPWQRKPPKYIKGTKFLYFYTTIDESFSTNNWWKRESLSEYMPVFTVDHAPLVEYVRKVGTIGSSDPFSNRWIYLKTVLDFISDYLSSFDPAVIVWALIIAALIIIYSKRVVGL